MTIATYRLKLTRANALKLRVSTRIPAQLVGGNGIDVTRANGAYTLDLNSAEISAMFGGEFQPTDATLTALAAVTGAADKLPYFSGSEVVSLTDFTAAARTLLDDATTADMRTTLGLNNVKTPDDYGAVGDGTTDDSTALQLWLNAIAGTYMGYVPPGRTYIFDGLLGIRSNTTIYGYGGTLKLKNSGAQNNGLVWANGTIDQINGADDVRIFGLTIDGNRVNQTNTMGSGALFYVVSSSRVVLEDVHAINGRSDGIYVGGSTTAPFPKRSDSVRITNARCHLNFRNGMSIVGLDYGYIEGGTFTNTGNDQNEGPMNGIDFEPDGASSQNSDITVIGVKCLANGNASLTTTGNAGLSMYGGNQVRCIAIGVQCDSNLKYGVENASSSSDWKLVGVSGAANGTALLSGAGGVDLLTPAVAVKGSFSAHKNAVDQSGIPTATHTKCTFTTEVFDNGSYYDAANSRWTPPSGPVTMTANVYITAGMTTTSQGVIRIYKNGAVYKEAGFTTTITSSGFGQVTVIDNANGTDYYEVYIYADQAGNKTVTGSIIDTYFVGSTL